MSKTVVTTQRADDFSDNYFFFSDSQEIDHVLTNYTFMLNEDIAEVTNVAALIGDGEYLEIWICTDTHYWLNSSKFLQVACN